jgi:FG-GAP-like repeat/ASPIC and UnbV
LPRRHAAVWILGATLLAAALASIVWKEHRRQPFDMVRTLAAIVRDEGAWDTPWDQQDRKIASLQVDLRRERDPVQRLILLREIAQQYVNGGTPEPAIALLDKVIADYRDSVSRQDLETLRSDLAFAYFRVGEQSNCATGVDVETCIVPFSVSAIHRQKLGAAEAAKIYAELLADSAVEADNALLYRWMLNLCAMQTGQYPDGVPKQWLIDPKVFASDYDVGRFKEVAASRGIVEFGRAGGAILEDFDNDGHLDLMISHFGYGDQLEYFHNNGDGRFTRTTESAGLKGLFGGLNIVQADYDNDGCIDVFVPRGAWYHDKGQIPSSLLHNNCDGTFTDVTAEAGVLNNYPTQTAVWADFNGDGLLDLFVGNELVRQSVRWPAAAPNFRLYINQGNGRFIDAGPESGIRVDGMIKGASVDDYDNDGRPDIYVSVMNGANHLFRNMGGRVPKFVDVTERAGVAEPIASFTTWFFDYDNDGWPDIFVSGYSANVANITRELVGDKANAKGARPRLYHNNRDGTFTDVSREMRLDSLLLTMGANFGDLDNDGWLDFYLGTGAAPLNNVVPNQMFRNDAGRGFQNVTTSGGFGHLQKGHAVAFGDIDNSGSQDVFETIGGAMAGDKFYSVLFKNPGNANHWLKLDLVGVKSNRFAVGARVRLQLRDEHGHPREIFRTIGSGGSFGASSLRLHVGIGGARSVDALEIRWPGTAGTVQRIAGPINGDAKYEVREGQTAIRKVVVSRAQPNSIGPAR